MKIISLAIPAALVSLGGPALASSPCPPGFAMLQSSDTCVRIGGRVRAETIVGSPRRRKADGFTNQASGRITLDGRKQTEYGPLRAVIAVDRVAR